MSIRFQADNDLKRIIADATLRREPRIDFQSAQTARLDHLDDENTRDVVEGLTLIWADDKSDAWKNLIAKILF